MISYELLSFIENQSNLHYSNWKNGDLFLHHSEFGIIYIIGTIYPLIKKDYSILKDINNIKYLYEISIFILRKIIDKEKNIDLDYSHNKFFKSGDFTLKIKKIINDEFLNTINQLLLSKQKDMSSLLNFLQ